MKPIAQLNNVPFFRAMRKGVKKSIFAPLKIRISKYKRHQGKRETERRRRES